MANIVNPAQDFHFENGVVTTEQILEIPADAFEKIEFVGISLPNLGSSIVEGFTLDGNQPPGLDIDSSGVISGTIEEIFTKLIGQIRKNREKSTNIVLELGKEEYPSPYEMGVDGVIRKDYVFEVTNLNQDPEPTGAPGDEIIKETWKIRVVKNWNIDIGDDFNKKTLEFN